MSLGLRFCTRRKGGNGWVHQKGTAWLFSGVGYRKALAGTEWAISLLLCMNQLRKQPFGLVGPPFLTMMLFIWSAWAESRNY